MTDSIQNQPPRWMRHVLIAAAIYNLLWGAVIVLLPRWSLSFLGMPEPNAIPIWQCLGMVIGVYGIGYGIAAANPHRHWPIVLVGLLGKLFGPIGFLFAATSGELPWSFGKTLIFNDLIWWIPFTIILWKSLRYHHGAYEDRPLPAGDDSPLHTLRSQHQHTLRELSNNRQVLVVFLRHAGCTFCREALQDLSQHRSEIEAAEVKLALVHLGDDESASEFFAQYELNDVDRYSDPERLLYQQFELQLGTFRQLMGLRVLWRGFQAAILQRHGFGRLQGNGFQLPGTFLIKDGEILTAHRHETAATRPDYTTLACPMPSQTAETP